MEPFGVLLATTMPPGKKSWKPRKQRGIEDLSWHRAIANCAKSAAMAQ
jgi:hypothetical protein